MANVSRKRIYVTLSALLLSAAAFGYFIQLSMPSHRLKMLRRAGTVNTSGTVSNSVSLKYPPLVCDEECHRFRRLLDAWPAGKPKGAVILLLKDPSSIAYFARSSHLFSANFNDAYNYPVIVFHEENMNNQTYRQRLRSVTNSSLYFQVRRILSYNLRVHVIRVLL